MSVNTATPMAFASSEVDLLRLQNPGIDNFYVNGWIVRPEYETEEDENNHIYAPRTWFFLTSAPQQP